MFYTITLIIAKCLLIYISRSPNKFLKATNSDIINYGIWIQTEVSLVISLWFLLMASTKISYKWTLIETLVEIDEILKNEFSMNLCYKDLKLYENVAMKEWIQLFLIFNFRCAILSVIAGSLAAFILFGLTIYFLIDIPFFNPLHKACVCFSIYMSNVCIYAITTEFICYISFIIIRFNSVNHILRQLLYDDSYLRYSIIDESTSKELIYTNYIPIDRKKCFLNTKSKISSIHMAEWMEQRLQNEHTNHDKPPIKLRFIPIWTLHTKM